MALCYVPPCVGACLYHVETMTHCYGVPATPACFQAEHCAVSIVRDAGTGQSGVVLLVCIGVVDRKNHILDAVLTVHGSYSQNFRVDLCRFSPAASSM